MRIIVLGGFGIQGRAALVDLARSEDVKEIICADSGLNNLGGFSGVPGLDKIRVVKLDAGRVDDLVRLMAEGAEAVIDLLPLPLMLPAFEAAVRAGVPLVSTNYASPVRHLDAEAREKGVTLMPECGLDPGIDLVIVGRGVKKFDRLEVLDSYCGGLPEASAADNPLKYKISWNWEMVLNSQMRPAALIRDGRRIDIPAEMQHDNDAIHTISYPGLGDLEAIPNGDAVFYTDSLGLTGKIRRTGRYSLRWPGWCEFWRPLKRLGFLDDRPLDNLPGGISPRKFMVHLLEPRLQYRDSEKDLAVMVNVFEGVKDGRRKRLTTRLLIERDLSTGLMAMSLGVGYTTSIVAQMIGRGEISASGLLSPVDGVPAQSFFRELEKRNILIEEEEIRLD